ncbi:DinB family protein [Paenibacillus sp. N1-5-1-14]|uniref:DinB family protein n=1 Tax=Paenibacillus radicibacter TaxID=2972488 RepID=UPI002158FA03|nr:DinB family protein [Paenibacillus radicibacter]MCR8641236.1 DinB family protein [Paenibacillus radicibacter]
MLSSRKLLLEQMNACYNEEGWFASFQTALDGVNVEHATWKASEDTNSIWEIVEHIIFWNERYLDRFNGVPLEQIEIVNQETFSLKDTEQTEEVWQSRVDALNTALAQWHIAVKTCEEAKLDSPFSLESDETWMEILLHSPIHIANHIGQIVFIRKLQGSWHKERW